MSTSEIRPRAGLLQILLDDPHTLEALAMALRLCDHAGTGGSVKLADGGELYWCAMCGASCNKAQGEPSRPEDWTRTSIVQLATAERARAFGDLCEAIRDASLMADVARDQSLDGGDLAFATVDQVKEQQRLLRRLATTLQDATNGDIIRTGSRVGAAAIGVVEGR